MCVDWLFVCARCMHREYFNHECCTTMHDANMQQEKTTNIAVWCYHYISFFHTEMSLFFFLQFEPRRFILLHFFSQHTHTFSLSLTLASSLHIFSSFFFLFSTLLLADTFAYIMDSICWNKFNYANTFHVFAVWLSTHRRHVISCALFFMHNVSFASRSYA